MKNSILFLTLILGLSCGNKKPSKPKLIILFSVDQMRADYLDSFQVQMPFVTEYFANGGSNFSNTKHYHAKTTTAAGHATISTGCYPSTHGIVNNNVYVRATDKSEYSILDTSITFIGTNAKDLTKVSAKNLKKPSIGDYIRENDSLSKSYSVALKDRASILMGGKNANRAFWFDGSTTQMISSDQYSEKFPTWVAEHSAQNVLAHRLEKGWLFDSSINKSYTIKGDIHTDSAGYECGIFKPWFPHTVGSMDTNYIRGSAAGSYFWHTPFGDEYVLDFASKLILEERLGKDEHTDMLCLGLSAADVIGHQFGPNSYEIADYYAKLDDYLKTFVAMLDKQVGKGNYVLALTADHGVCPMPEKQIVAGAQRIQYKQFDDDMNHIDNQLKSLFGVTKSTFKHTSYNGVEPDFEFLNSQGIDSNRYLDSLTSLLTELDYLDDVFTQSELASSTTSDREYLDYYRHSFDPRFEYYVQFLAKPYYLVDMRSCGTTHGSPWSYDTHVPFIVAGSGIKTHKDSNPHYTVDIAPTLLHLLDIDVKKEVDGESLPLH